MLEDSPHCKYFEESVLPLKKTLEALYHADRKAKVSGYELTESQKQIITEEAATPKPRLKCRQCGQIFQAGSNRQKYCSKCRKWVTREQARNRVQKQRIVGEDVTH